jgi:hypothetical protein
MCRLLLLALEYELADEGLPGNGGPGAGAVSTKSLSPSIRQGRFSSVPFHVSSQETSTKNEEIVTFDPVLAVNGKH